MMKLTIPLIKVALCSLLESPVVFSDVLYNRG